MLRIKILAANSDQLQILICFRTNDPFYFKILSNFCTNVLHTGQGPPLLHPIRRLDKKPAVCRSRNKDNTESMLFFIHIDRIYIF